MADQNAPKESPSPASASTRSAEVYEAAKAKLRSLGIDLGKIDVKSDGIEEGDAAYRDEALKFIDRECLRLPDAEFGRLVDQIVEVLKRKDVEIGSVVTESKAALDALRNSAAAESASEKDIGPRKPETSEPLSDASPVSAFVDAAVSADPEAGAAKLAAYFIDCDRSLRDRRITEFLVRLEADPEAIKRIEAGISGEKPVSEALGRIRGDRGETLWWNIERVVTSAIPADSAKDAEKSGKIDAWTALRKKYRGIWNGVFSSEFKTSGAKDATELAKTISALYATDEARPHCDILVNEIRTNPVVALELVANFPEGCPLEKELRKTEDGKYACNVLKSMRVYAASLHGLDPNNLPKGFSENLAKQIGRSTERTRDLHELEDANDAIRMKALALWKKVRGAFVRGEALAKDPANKSPWSEIEDMSGEINLFFKTDVADVREFRDEKFGNENESQRPEAWSIVENVAATRGMFDEFIGFARNQDQFWCFGNAKDYSLEQMKARLAAYDENFEKTNQDSTQFVYEKRNPETGAMETVKADSGEAVRNIRNEIAQSASDPNWPKEPELVAEFLEDMHARS